MSNYLDSINVGLPAQTDAGKIRLQVLTELPWAPTPTTMVSYVSSNRVLIIAEQSRALEIQAMMPEKMQTYLAFLTDDTSVSGVANGWNVSQLSLTGYLGRFEAFMDLPHQDEATGPENSLGLALNIANGLFDQVVDCSPIPLISAAIKPPGYYHIVEGDPALEDTIEQLSQLIGEFDKPRYFNYDPDICAHGNSGISGCTRCIDACPTQAIISIGDKVEVNPYLCQGGGSCASSCPSGAISYTYPRAEEQIEFLRQLLQKIRHGNQNQGISLLIYDNEHGAEQAAGVMADIPETVIPFVVEDIGSVGLDLLGCAFAFGANEIYVYMPASVSSQVNKVMTENINLLMHVVDELELDGYHLHVVQDLKDLVTREPLNLEIREVARFAPAGTKRDSIRSALDHLKSIARTGRSCISLPEGSLFGQINLDQDACTLCMACVSVCPAKALQDGGDSPALKFIESNCVQCGICANACPESAIELEPRIHFDRNTTHTARPMKEEQPFRCLKCGKPFATQSMIKTMTEKLKGHWMFNDDAAIKRLQMCEDCRVIDMFQDK